MKKKRLRKPKEEIIFPGDWIEYVTISGNRHEKKIGKVLEINKDLQLIVSYGASTEWSKPKDWWTKIIDIRNVIKKYPRFGILPIPGKIKELEDIEKS